MTKQRVPWPRPASHAGVDIALRTLCGGIFAQRPESVPQYSCLPATERALGSVRAMRTICDEYHIPLGVVALQFSQRYRLRALISQGQSGAA